MVIFNFIRDPEVGIFARAKRLSKEAKALQIQAADRKTSSESEGKGRTVN